MGTAETEVGSRTGGLGIARVAALAAVIGAVVLVGLLLFGGSDAYTVKVRFLNGSQLVKGNVVDIGGTNAGLVTDLRHHAGRAGRGHARDRREVRAAAPRRARPGAVRRPDVGVGPLRAADAAGRERGGRGHRRRRADRRRQHHHEGRHRPVLQHLRPAHAQGDPGLLRGRLAPVRRPRRAGQPRPDVPQPAARRVEPAVRGAEQRPAGAGALPGRLVALRDRARRPPRRPRGADRQPQLHHARAGQREDRAGRGDRAPAPVHAAGEHHLPEPAHHPRRARPVRGGVEAGGAQAAALPRRAAPVRARGRAHRAPPAAARPHARAPTTTCSSSSAPTRRWPTSPP